MLEEGVEFKDAILLLAKRFNVENKETPKTEQTRFVVRTATDSEKEGDYSFKYRDFTEEELQILGKFVVREICTRYHLKCVESYNYTKNRKTFTNYSSPDYPIFVWDYDTFKKIYKPLEPKKEFRFLWVGTRPKDFIFGLDVAKKAYEKRLSDEISEENEGDTALDKLKLDAIVIASGERDALNIASAGYIPVCFNSETANITIFEINKLDALAKNIYNIPDLDATGVNAARTLALQHLKIKTAWLPDLLKTHTDFRGNPCKDTTDFFRHYDKWKFKDLINAATSFKFWEEKYSKVKGGNLKIDYEISNSSTYEFLQGNGYCKIEDKNSKTLCSFVAKNKNVVKKVDSGQIRDFINKYMIDNNFNPKLRDAIYRTNQLKEASLLNIPIHNLDFVSAEKDYQLLFFKNSTWKVTANGIEEIKGLGTSKFVWEHKIIDKQVKRLDPLFKTFNPETLDFELNKDFADFSYTKFLINTSNNYWGVARGERTEEQKNEIKKHFLNKLTVIGYMLHRYKNPSTPVCPYALDMRESSNYESNGGTGKSVFFKAIRQLLTTVVLNGRDKKLTTNPHVYENVDEHTDMIHIEDTDTFIDINFFFNAITSSIPVNPKHQKGYELPFDKSPKLAIDTNFALRKADQSILRRLHFLAFSDYYHKKDKRYESEVSPSLEFGKSFFVDWDEKEYNLFFNLMANCIQLYLQVGLINAPMESIEKRNQRQQMGEDFLEWSEEYFTHGRLNCMLPKKDLYDGFRDNFKYSQKEYSSHRFKKNIEAYCAYSGYEFNPAKLITDKAKHRIITGSGIEMYYIQANIKEVTEPTKEEIGF
jgi:hypothetical protein